MRLLMLVLPLLSFTLAAHALEDAERDRLAEELPRAAQELADAYERMTTALERLKITPPAMVKTTLQARQTLEQDWEKRLMDPTAKIEAEEVDHFREQLDGLHQRMEEVLNQVDTIDQIADRWPRSAETPELARFKDFMHSRITKGLSVIAAGADSPAEDEAAARLQRCHEVLLQTIEAGHQADERWGQVPPDAPALREFHDQRHTLRTLAERGLTDPKVLVGPALDRGEAILGFLDEMVQLIQSREEHLADRDTAGSAAVVTAVAACLGGEEQSLRALIAHERLPITDERTWNRQGEDLRHERERRARLTGLAWEWFELVIGLPDLHQNLEQQLTDAPDAARAEAHAQWNALDTARAVIETALGKALQERSRVAAVQAKGDLSILRHGYDDLLEDIDQRLHQDQEESEWRKRAGEPGIAKALARLDAARTALNKARTAQRNLDEAAAKAQVGRELAEIAAEEAQEAAEHIRQDTDQMREELEQRRQQVRDALDNPEPKPEGDTKF